MATATDVTFVYTTIDLPRFDARDIPLAYRKGNRKEQYVPVGVMCDVLGVDHKGQLKTIKARWLAALRELPLDTVKGMRPANWIRTGECALWIGEIEPARCSLETRERIEQFKADFMAAAERLLFEGGSRKPTEKRGMFAHSQRAEYIFACLYCGGGHRMIAQNGEVTLERHEF